MWKPIILDVECIVCNKTLQKIKHDPRQITRNMGKIVRRTRTPNWSLEEKQYLLELIKENKEVVIKTNNGPNCSEEKDVAWNEILRKLAGKFGDKFSRFSIKKVKTQWQNMKRIAREEITMMNGSGIHQFTKQSLDVINILDLNKSNVVKMEDNSKPSVSTNIEIKTECVDENITEFDESSVEIIIQPENLQELNNTIVIESSESSISEHNNLIDIDNCDMENNNNRRSTSVMTDETFLENVSNTSFHRELQEFLKYSATEKCLKMESLKEERQVVRAMRETAELNKIIAEQKLKHVLWMKKQEMSMYSGEPGSGAGKGGGGGGAIREAGGAFGKMEAAREDEYFYKKQKEQLANIKGHLDKEIAFHQEQIKRHEDAIRRHKEQQAEINANK